MTLTDHHSHRAETGQTGQEGETIVPEEDTESSRDRETRARRAALASGALLVLSLVVLVIGLLSWSRAEPDGSIEFAKQRDDALIQATAAVETFNSLDANDIEAGIEKWKAVSAGDLRQQLDDMGANAAEALAAGGKNTTGTVTEAGLTAFDPRAGTASGIFLVELTVRDGAGEPQLKRNRFEADLIESDGTWKLTRLEPVAVSIQ